MQESQILGLVLLALLAGGLVLVFRRASGVKPRPDNRHEDWPNITGGGH